MDPGKSQVPITGAGLYLLNASFVYTLACSLPLLLLLTSLCRRLKSISFDFLTFDRMQHFPLDYNNYNAQLGRNHDIFT